MSHSVQLDISGMTCASCAARIEKKLNKLDGVSATVNFATEQAHVEVVGPDVPTGELVEAIEKLGYSAALPQAERTRSLSPTRRWMPRPLPGVNVCWCRELSRSRCS